MTCSRTDFRPRGQIIYAINNLRDETAHSFTNRDSSPVRERTMKQDKHTPPNRQGVVTDPYATPGKAEPVTVSPDSEKASIQSTWPDTAADGSSTPGMPDQLPPIVVPPPPPGQKSATAIIARLPRQTRRCRVCRRNTKVANDSTFPLCEKCATSVVPQAIAHAVIVNNPAGDDRLATVLAEVQQSFLTEIDRLARQAREKTAAMTIPS
jgi:hypothetical protein